MAQRKTRVTASILAAALFTLAASAQAAPTTWTIDPTHSNVTFTIRHFFSKVTGSFNKFSGTIVHDPANPAASSAKAEIDASSIYTANERRDNHLRSADFFDVAKHPTLTFESTKVSHEGGKLKIDGNLTMHGVTKPVTLEGEFLGAGPTASGERAGFEVTGKLDRKEFGILWNKVADQGGAVLGDDVQIRIAVEATGELPAGAKKADSGGGKAADKKGESSSRAK